MPEFKNTSAINPENPLESAPTFRSNFSIPVNENAPWEGDRLNRKESAELLTKLLSNAETPFTLVVNSAWGTGKTFFIERWHTAIKREHFSFYFSAWEAELYPSPTIAFVNEFREALKSDSELYCRVDDFLDDFFVKILIFAIAIPVLLKTGAAKAVELAQGSSFLQGILSLGGDKIQEKFNAALQEKTPTIKEVRKSFQELIEKIQSESSRKAPIYIFVDELDRCRPDFAIRFLEEIKHLFSVPGIVFVLSLDLEQLNISIKHVYGQNIRCEGYLRRFVNQFYNLSPIPNESFIEKLFEGFEHSQYSSIIGNKKGINSIFVNCANCFSPSLRDMEAIFARYSAIVKTSSNGSIFLVPIAYFLFVQTIHPELWRDAMRKKNFNQILPKTLVNNNLIKNWPHDYNGFTPIADLEIQLASYGEELTLKQVRDVSPPPSHNNEEIRHQRQDLALTIEEHFEAFKSQITLIELNANSFGYREASE